MDDRSSSAGIAVRSAQGPRKRHGGGDKGQTELDQKSPSKIHPPPARNDSPLALALQHKWSITLVFFTVLGFVTRFWQIWEPTQVVFDEVHFGKFAAQYIKRTYFFDVHPPFGKLLFALVGWLAGFDGKFEFDNIGDDYIENKVPYIIMRALPATMGALHVPLCVDMARSLGFSHATSILVGVMILLETAFITQCRLILLDSALIFFATLSAYCWVRFYNKRYSPYTTSWWGWMVATGVSLGCAIGVKMVGLFVVLLVGLATAMDLWRLLDWRRGLSTADFITHFLARVFGLIVVPICTYLLWFWIHFAILTHSGPGDAFMSHRFQSELRGSGMSGRSTPIPYFSNITLRHRDTSAYLHSHPDTYPLRYDDNRVSSQGQQVTGYPHRDENNVWKIEPVDLEMYPNGTKVHSDDEKEGVRYLRNGDFVRLVHFNTMSRLLTHDVASPTMSTNMEVTTSPVLDDPKRYGETLWKIEADGVADGGKIRTITNYVKFVSVVHKVALYTQSGALPTWAYGQQEVNGNKGLKDKGNQWFFEDVWPDTGEDDESQNDAASSLSQDISWQESAITHYAVVKVTNLFHNSCLYSDTGRYPLTYEDKRVSSNGQRVALAAQDSQTNCLWMVEPVGSPFPHAQSIHRDDVGKTRYLRDGDLVRLTHALTETQLFTHDVASPLTSTNMEVSTAAIGEQKRNRETVWRLEMFPDTYNDFKLRPPIYRLPSRKPVLKGGKSSFRLINAEHNVALSSQNAKLPVSWGNGLAEVNGNKDMRDGVGNIWGIQSVASTKPQPAQPESDLPQQKPKTKAKPIKINLEAHAEQVPMLGFFSKFFELQSLMIQHNALLTKSHPYQSRPISWVFLNRGISFWERKGPPAWRQIYLLGNPFAWWAHAAGVPIFALFWVLDRVLLRRGVDEVGGVNRRWADRALGFVFVGWALHYVPFFIMGRALFLHHYLPALVFGYLTTAGVIEYAMQVLGKGPSRVYGEEGRKAREDELHKEWVDGLTSERIRFRERSKYGGVQTEGDNWMSTPAMWVVVACLVGVLCVGFYLFAQFAYGLEVDDLDQVRAKKWLSSWDFQFL